MENKVIGKRGRGRPKILQDINHLMQIGKCGMKVAVLYRREWLL